jgi:hypothetical protein
MRVPRVVTVMRSMVRGGPRVATTTEDMTEEDPRDLTTIEDTKVVDPRDRTTREARSNVLDVDREGTCGGIARMRDPGEIGDRRNGDRRSSRMIREGKIGGRRISGPRIRVKKGNRNRKSRL